MDIQNANMGTQSTEYIAPEANDLHLLHESVGALEHKSVDILYHVSGRLDAVRGSQIRGER